MEPDGELLRQYADRQSQPAVAALVQRHMDLVYSAALRRLSGDNGGAAEVAQQVFISMARNARRLADHPALIAWFHTATRNAAFNFMKAQRRRRAAEAAAANDPSTSAEPELEWVTLQPVIDDALMQRLITFESAARPKAEAILQALPPEVRAKAATIEALAAMLLVEDGMQHPFPRADLLARARVEPVFENIVRTRLPGTTRDGGFYERVGSDWKFVVTEESVDEYVAKSRGR